MLYKGDYYLSDGTRKKTREYMLYQNMKSRCSDKYKQGRLTYADCTVSDKFKDFQYFANWCNRQIGFLLKDSDGRFFQLDKDILYKGNKLYSEDTCVFVPKDINVFFAKADSIRGSLPIGVRHKNSTINPYGAEVTNPFLGGLEYLGLFPTKETAFEAYKQRKHEIAVMLANKHRQVLRDDVYNILMNYYPDIND